MLENSIVFIFNITGVETAKDVICNSLGRKEKMHAECAEGPRVSQEFLINLSLPSRVSALETVGKTKIRVLVVISLSIVY
jgi:hypothetical protein